MFKLDILSIGNILWLSEFGGEVDVDNVFQRELIHWDKRSKTSMQKSLLREEPLSIRVEGNPYAVVMRTPGDEIAHVAGFCLTEGIIDTPDDLTSIGFCEDDDTNVVTVTLTPSRRKKISEILDRRGGGYFRRPSRGTVAVFAAKSWLKIFSRLLSRSNRTDPLK